MIWSWNLTTSELCCYEKIFVQNNSKSKSKIVGTYLLDKMHMWHVSEDNFPIFESKRHWAYLLNVNTEAVGEPIGSSSSAGVLEVGDGASETIPFFHHKDRKLEMELELNFSLLDRADYTLRVGRVLHSLCISTSLQKILSFISQLTKHFHVSFPFQKCVHYCVGTQCEFLREVSWHRLCAPPHQPKFTL